MYSVVVVFPKIGIHDGSSVRGVMARKFRSENFWDFAKSEEFFGIIRNLTILSPEVIIYLSYILILLSSDTELKPGPLLLNTPVKFVTKLSLGDNVQ
jgi:hypothetical protein